MPRTVTSAPHKTILDCDFFSLSSVFPFFFVTPKIGICKWAFPYTIWYIWALSLSDSKRISISISIIWSISNWLPMTDICNSKWMRKRSFDLNDWLFSVFVLVFNLQFALSLIIGQYFHSRNGEEREREIELKNERNKEI